MVGEDLVLWETAQLPSTGAGLPPAVGTGTCSVSSLAVGVKSPCMFSRCLPLSSIPERVPPQEHARVVHLYGVRCSMRTRVPCAVSVVVGVPPLEVFSSLQAVLNSTTICELCTPPSQPLSPLCRLALQGHLLLALDVSVCLSSWWQGPAPLLFGPPGSWPLLLIAEFEE